MMMVLLLLDLKRSWVVSRISDYTSVVFRRIGCESRGAVCGNSWVRWPLMMMGWQLGGVGPFESCGMQRGASEKRWVRVASRNVRVEMGL